MVRNTLFAALSGVFTLLAGPVRADSTFVACRVFHDLNADGARQMGEPDVADAWLTNGEEIFLTDSAGHASFWVDQDKYRFATLTMPKGLWASNTWFHRVSMAGPDSVEFGLADFPGTASDPVRWVLITDTQIQGPVSLYPFDVDLQAINDLDDPPLFLMHTGDIVSSGTNTADWIRYAELLETADQPVLHVRGNRDSPIQKFEEHIGPPYWVHEFGSWLCVGYNMEQATTTTPSQDAWLDDVLASAPPAANVTIVQHRLLADADLARVLHWAAAGVDAVFSGHWHSLQLSEHHSGIRDFGMTRMPSGGIDRTPRCFAIVELGAAGAIDFELRRLGVDHRVEITHPQIGGQHEEDSIDVLIQAYDTSSNVADLRVSVTGPGGTAPTVSASAVSWSLWRAAVDVASLPGGTYDVNVVGSFGDGTVIDLARGFDRVSGAPIVPAPAGDWPMFRRCPAGSSFVPTALPPPLELAWVVDAPALIALSSPVVAGGNVYLGTRQESGDVSESGIISLDAMDGSWNWFTEIPGGVALAPAVTGNVLVATAMTDSVFGLDITTGSVLWSVKSPGEEFKMSAPIVSGSRVWVGSKPNTMELLWANGQEEWTSDLLGLNWFPFLYTAPTVSDDHVYFGLFPYVIPPFDGFHIVERATGTRIFVEDGAFRSPIWTGQDLFVVGGLDRTDQGLTGRDELGNVKWTATTRLGQGTGAPALAHGTIVVPGDDGVVEAFRASDGLGLWSFPVGDALLDEVPGLRGQSDTHATPAIADTVVYIPSLDGNLYALSLNSGAELWRWSFGVPMASSPAITGNLLFVGGGDGQLYAFVSSGPAVPTEVGLGQIAPDRLALALPRPNPGLGGVRLDWSQPVEGIVRLEIFDLAGRRVRLLEAERAESGPHHVFWDGRDDSGRPVASGVYFVRVRVGEQSAVRKLVFLRR